MTYEDAIYNLTQARCIPYRKATYIKIESLLNDLKELKAHREAWEKLQEEMDRLDPDNNGFSVKNNACLLVDICRPKEGNAE